ncbi:hypothetical protein B4134_1394 [Bacillus safensis]|nr:hypothetical protein B4134_1394 [Bacillus safensis]
MSFLLLSIFSNTFIILMKRDMILKLFYALFSFSSKRKDIL